MKLFYASLFVCVLFGVQYTPALCGFVKPTYGPHSFLFVSLWFAHILYHLSADVWAEGDLPPGWREISDTSEVYFWHVPTGTTQYDRPIASANQELATNNEPDSEHDPQRETQDSLKLPNEVRGPRISKVDFYIVLFAGLWKNICCSVDFFCFFIQHKCLK